jgi:hypothetical protein
LSSLPSHAPVDVESWLERGTIDDPDGTATPAGRYSPTAATTGQSHPQITETPREFGGDTV